VQGIRRVALVEHDLAPVERPPAGDRQHLLELVGRHVGEKAPLHAPTIRNPALNVTYGR
jgi:hypothetical protein